MSKKVIIVLIILICIHAKLFANQPAVKDSFYIRMATEQKIGEAIENGDDTRLLKYINSGLDINKRFWDGSTILCDAIQYKQPEIVKLLLDLGADPNLRTAPFKGSDDKWIPEDSPLEMAIVFDSDYSIAGLLLKHGANINDTDIYYGTALHEVISGKGDKMMSELYSQNGDTNKLKRNQSTALKKVLWLIKNGANINAKNSFGNPPLYNAISSRYYDIAEILIDKGAEVNLSGNTEKTLLHLVESPEFTLKLIKKGADVNAREKDGLTPLHFAIFSNNYAKTKILIENNADVNIKDYDSHLTPLGWLIIDSFDTDIAKLLISHGAEIPEDLVIKYGWKDEFEKIKKELKR